MMHAVRCIKKAAIVVLIRKLIQSNVMQAVTWAGGTLIASNFQQPCNCYMVGPANQIDRLWPTAVHGGTCWPLCQYKWAVHTPAPSQCLPPQRPGTAGVWAPPSHAGRHPAPRHPLQAGRSPKCLQARLTRHKSRPQAPADVNADTKRRTSAA